jgi:arylformamidase
VSVSWQDRQTGELREFSQEDLDAALSPSRFVDSLDDELEVYAQRSQAARDTARAQGLLHEAVAYAEQKAARLDLFLPPDVSEAPLLVYMHGGFWQQLGREDSSFAAPGTTEHGGAFAALGYTLAPKATLGEIVDEMRTALAWLYRNGPDYGIDRTRIVVSGSSAGAHLAAMLLLTDWVAFDLPEQIIAGAVLVSGVYDLSAVARSYVNQPLGLSREDNQILSPRRQVPRHTCPVRLVYSANEPDEFKRESRCYAEVLRHHGQRTVVREIAQRQHFDVILDLSDANTYLGHTAMAMMGLIGAGESAS